jgi:hypothetical protein
MSPADYPHPPDRDGQRSGHRLNMRDRGAGQQHVHFAVHQGRRKRGERDGSTLDPDFWVAQPDLLDNLFQLKLLQISHRAGWDTEDQPLHSLRRAAGGPFCGVGARQ